MRGSEFDEAEFFRAIAESRARAFLIGRRALVALGIPGRLGAPPCARLSLLAERQLSPEEVRAALEQPLGEAEEEESRSLIRWFRRRYPMPAARLAHARRAYHRWRAVRLPEEHSTERP